MVKKKATAKKVVKKEDEGESLDDAFADDDDVDYAESKPVLKTKTKINKIKNNDDGIEEVQIKSSKPISKIKKGDKVKVDGKEYEVDAHVVLIDHGKTKEMAIECFDKKTDKDYQLRYFDDQVNTSLEFYELAEIVYNRIDVKKIEW
jgi:hypothetical protein